MLLDVIADSRRRYVYDVDAQSYIEAAESADGERLEDYVRIAINSFVVGCKLDASPVSGVSNWEAMSVFRLPGARSLVGSYKIGKGADPTGVNLVNADYSRTGGWLGNGTNKSLNTNRNNNADPQDDFCMWFWLSEPSNGAATHVLMGTANNNGSSGITSQIGSSRECRVRLRQNGAVGVSPLAYALNAGYRAGQRNSSSSIELRSDGATSTATATSQTALNANIHVLSSGVANYSTARIAAYGIGRRIDNVLMESRVATYISAIADLS